MAHVYRHVFERPRSVEDARQPLRLSPLSLGPPVPALGRFWYATGPSTRDSSRTGRSRSKTCQVPRSCDENVLLDATRSGPSCEGCLDPEMWDYWWTLIRDLRTALERNRLSIEELKALLGAPTRSGPSSDADPPPHSRGS